MKKKNVLQEKNSRIRKKNGDRGGVRAQEGGGGGEGVSYLGTRCPAWRNLSQCVARWEEEEEEEGRYLE